MQCLKKREALLSKLAANKFQINSGTFIAMLLFRILATVKNDKKITVDFSRETVIFLLIKPVAFLKGAKEELWQQVSSIQITIDHIREC